MLQRFLRLTHWFWYIVAAMLVIQTLNALLGYPFTVWGILPRTVSGLKGILLAPFVHVSWGHLFNNLVVLIPLSLILLLRSAREFWLASALIILGGGATEWLLAREAYHIGASGWVFGLWGVLLANAWFRRSWVDLLLGLLVLIYLGSLFFGLLPARGISFEGHLFGVLWGGLYVWGRERLKARHHSE